MRFGLGIASLPAQSTFRRYCEPAAFAAGRHPFPGFEYLVDEFRAPVCASPSRSLRQEPASRAALDRPRSDTFGAPAACRPRCVSVDVCNPHFKDEHPFHATATVALGLLPRAVGRAFSRHPDPLRRPAAPLCGRCLPTTRHVPPTLAPLSPSDAVRARNPARPIPGGLGCFRHGPVKGRDLVNPVRLPSTSSPSRAGDRSSDFAIAVRSLEALRPPRSPALG